jgi:hypothetical protein
VHVFDRCKCENDDHTVRKQNRCTER